MIVDQGRGSAVKQQRLLADDACRPGKDQAGGYSYRPKPGCKPGGGGMADFLELLWYRFELQSNLYMLDKTEKRVIYFLMLCVIIVGWYNTVKFAGSIL